MAKTISQGFPSKFIKASDLEGRDVRVSCEGIFDEDVGDSTGETKMVLHFVGKAKGLVLNRTNANVLIGAFGDDRDAVMGKPVILYPSETPYLGKVVPCIRIKLDTATAATPVPAAAKAQDEPIVAEDIPF